MKNFFLLLFSVISIASSAQSLTTSLQACYPFDLNAQNYAATGAVLNGTLVNVTPTNGHTNLPNTAYKVNGTTSSYIVLPSHPGIKSNFVFFSGWFRVDSIPDPNAFPSLSYLVYTHNGCTTNFEAYSLSMQYTGQGGALAFCLSKAAGDCSNKPQINSTTVPALGNWYHVCFYISNSVMKLYINGSLETSINHTAQFAYQAGKNVFLGVTNESNFDKPFKGAIDDVRFYDRELTQQEVTQLYTQNVACSLASAPTSSFAFTNKLICRGSSVTFSDQSTNTPTAWSWQFQGGSPATSTLSNPSINFPVAGTYTVSLVASNAAGAGISSVQTITVSSCAGIEYNRQEATFLVYPNPASDRIYVQAAAEHDLVITNALGQKIMYRKTLVSETNYEVVFENAASGIYTGKITSVDGVVLQNFKFTLLPQ